ncbi:hypothetical protein RGF97_20955 [Streptomyces roseicoloratus]|uniref:Lipoprotein n=1 Tax=Streptomyces roseicoloratus TaxID=2508722 RepID=A0ABY9S031_9ACTN|nr:hypothetical protein [Streptomyces roseicoloratus]WMX46799.1 hypothetical protein RGF97_20955 [Streptomyces roseicoloratus]
MTEKKTKRAIVSIAAGLAVCVTLAACGGADEPEEPRVTATQQCDDTLSPAAVRALETNLGATKFDHGPKGGLDRVAAQLTDDYEAGGRRSPARKLCQVGAAGARGRIDITFSRYDDSELFEDARPVGLYPYLLGREAMAGPETAYLFVECASPQLQGSQKRPARIDGRLRVSEIKLPDTPPIREANLTVLHSVTLAVVKKLGCENNAGLPDKPVFRPRPD